MTIALIAISVIPFGPVVEIGGVQTAMQMTDLPIGILFILALSAWACMVSRSPDGLRTTSTRCLADFAVSAQMISYELPMAMALAAPLLMINTLSLRQMVEQQSRFLLRVSSRMDRLHGAVPADHLLYHFHDRGVR